MLDSLKRKVCGQQFSNKVQDPHLIEKILPAKHTHTHTHTRTPAHTDTHRHTHTHLNEKRGEGNVVRLELMPFQCKNTDKSDVWTTILEWINKKISNN